MLPRRSIYDCRYKDYLLAIPMAKAEYMNVKYKHISHDLKDRYKFHDKVTNSEYIYLQIKRASMGSSKQQSSHTTVYRLTSNNLAIHLLLALLKYDNKTQNQPRSASV